MSEFTPELAGRVRRAVLLDEWRAQLRAGHLTIDGLQAVRWKLDPESCLLDVSPEVERLRLDVDQAIADHYGAPLSDLPGRDLPDSPGDLPPAA